MPAAIPIATLIVSAAGVGASIYQGNKQDAANRNSANQAKENLTFFEDFTEILAGSLGYQMTFPIKNDKIRKNNPRIEEKRCKKRFW